MLAHAVQDISPTAATVGKRMPSPIIVSRLLINDTKELLEWEDLGPALPKVDVWPGNEKIIGCCRAVLTYATGTNLFGVLAERHQSSAPLSTGNLSVYHKEQPIWMLIGNQ